MSMKTTITSDQKKRFLGTADGIVCDGQANPDDVRAYLAWKFAPLVGLAETPEEEARMSTGLAWLNDNAGRITMAQANGTPYYLMIRDLVFEDGAADATPRTAVATPEGSFVFREYLTGEAKLKRIPDGQGTAPRPLGAAAAIKHLMKSPYTPDEAALPESVNQILVNRKRLVAALRAFRPPEDMSEWRGGAIGTLAEVVEAIRNDEPQLMLALSADVPGQVSYAASPADTYSSRRRRRTTLARFIRRRLGVDMATLNDVLLTYVVNNVMAKAEASGDSGAQFAVLRGKGIEDAYFNQVGGSSCMTRTRGIVSLYAANPEKIGLVTYTVPAYEPGAKDVSARALLWTTDEGKEVLDRIYPDDKGRHIEVVREWARKRGCAIRTENCMGCRSFDTNAAYSATLRLPDNDMYPYLDTFQWGVFHRAEDRLYVSTDKDYLQKKLAALPDSGGLVVHPHCFTMTDGEAPDRPEADDGIRACDSCGGELSEGDQFYTDDGVYCESCYDETFTRCDHCDETVARDRACRVDGDSDWCSSCLENNASLCDRCEEYTSRDLTTVETSDGDQDWCPWCVEDYADCCEHCGTYTSRGLETVITDNEGGTREWCKDCVEEDAVACDSCDAYMAPTVAVAGAKGPVGLEHWCPVCMAGQVNETNETNETTKEGTGHGKKNSTQEETEEDAG